ncbi:MAG: hypothetical protein RLZZ310_134, partial [Pseudomonadota bacterium]
DKEILELNIVNKQIIRNIFNLR